MKLTKTEKSKNNGQGYGTSNDCLNTSRYNESGGKRVVDQSCSQKYISKSGKAMTTDEYREGYTEAISDLYRGFYEEWVSKEEGDYVIMINKILNLQQENARLKKQKDILKDNRDLWFKKSIHNGREIKRLRQALEEIKGLSKKKTMLNYCGSWLPMEEVFKIIDKALKGEKR